MHGSVKYIAPMKSLTRRIVVPNHLEYIILDSNLTIIDRSWKATQFVVEANTINRGQDIRLGFAELQGYEEDLQSILLEEKDNLQLRSISRFREEKDTIFINLFVNLYKHPENEQKCLIVFLEDVTEQILLERNLVQVNNEANLFFEAFSASQQYFSKLITSMADAMVVLDFEGTIKAINQAAQDVLGYGENELVGNQFLALINDNNISLTNVHRELLANKEQGICKNIEITCRNKSGEHLTISFSCSLVETELKGSYDFIYIGRDITQSKRAQQRQAVQYSVARVLSETSSLEQATPEILQSVCESLSWNIGELWTPITINRNSKNHLEVSSDISLRRMEIWSKNADAAGKFIEVTKQIYLPSGMGLAGRVWASQCPQWITNVNEDADFGQSSFAVKAGLSSAFGFPIQNRGEVLGVMTFFSRETQKIDPEVLKIMTAIGNQLGQFIQRKKVELALREEQKQTETLLLNILPLPIAERLKQQPSTIADSFDEVTVLFADLVGFTHLASSLSPIELVEILNAIFSEFDRLTEKYGLEKIKTVGDAYMVVGGLPTQRENHAEAIAEMALDIQTVMARFNTTQEKPFSIRIGVNTGSVVAGVIGTKKFTYDLWGDTVNIASRMESQGIADEIQVTEETFQRLRDEYNFQQRGLVDIKGKGKMPTYLLKSRKAEATF